MSGFSSSKVILKFHVKYGETKPKHYICINTVFIPAHLVYSVDLSSVMTGGALLFLSFTRSAITYSKLSSLSIGFTQLCY